MSEWGGGGEGIISSAGQVSNYDPRWRHRKPDLSSVPLQNNGCTAGYSVRRNAKKSTKYARTIQVPSP